MSRRWDDAAGVVTPEAVPLQFEEASVGSRAVAFLLDFIALGMLLGVVNVGIGFLFTDGAPVPEWVAITTLLVANFVIFFGYPIGFETLLGGRSPGKVAMGLRVVTVEGAPERFRHAAIRAALGLVDFLLTTGIAAILATLLSKRHQRLGDMVAGTVVLRERTASAPPRASRFFVPPGAESYAATIDPSGLSARDYEAVREFLLRAHSLRADARDDLGRRLASGLAAKLGHTPPDSVSPELFLMCLAARHQQDEQRTAAQASGAPPAPASVGASPPPPPPAAGERPADEPVAQPGPSPTWDDFAPPR